MTSHYNELGELGLPLIQICEGILTLYPIPKYFPLFIQILGHLNEFSRFTEQYIPIIKIALFTLLDSKEFLKKKNNKKPKAFDFEINIKVQKEYSQTNLFWNAAFNEILDILIDFLSIHSKKVYFPEIVSFVIYNLKKLQKKYNFNFYKTKIKLLLQKIHHEEEKILAKRKKTNFSITKPNETLQFESSKEKKSVLEEDYERIHQEKENLKKQKILAEKEEQSELSEAEESEEEENNEIEAQNRETDDFDEDLQDKPLSEEEDLDLE